MVKVALSQIHATTRAALIRHGAEDWIADAVAAAVTEAESYGNRICGLYYLESYCQQLVSGRVDGRAEPVVSRPRPGVVEVDARYGFAQPAFLKGLPVALEAARELGVAALAVGHAHTCTALGHFTRQIARAGLIGLGMTNASPIVAGPGGRKRLLGTNPISLAVPDGQGGVAMIFDQATSATALGHVTMARARGEAIPEGWAVDSEGRPTTDPEAALGGALLPAGGHRGWGLGLMVEILAAGMTGSTASVDVQPLKAPEGPPHDLGQYYLLIDPGSSESFHERFARVAEAVASDPAVRLPGAGKVPADPAEIDDAAWALAQKLAGRGG